MSDEWYTPAYVFDALGVQFDLDVASPEGGSNCPCQNFYFEDGEKKNWSGFVWMNPPYGHQSTKRIWLDRFFDHGNGIALMPDRTSAPWWQEYAPRSDLVLFMTPKIKFEKPDGSLGESPSNGTCLFGVGAKACEALVRASHLGRLFAPLRVTA